MTSLIKRFTALFFRHDCWTDAVRVTVAKVAVRPGDTFVVTTPRPLTRNQIEAVREQVLEALPADTRVLVVPGGLVLAQVIGPGEHERRQEE